MTKKFHISKLKPSIFQGSLDFETVAKRQSQVLAMEYPVERMAFIALLGLLTVLFFSYFYFVVGSVFHVIGEKQADARSANLQSSINSLEQQYFSLSQALTPQAAADMGLAPIKNTQYVYRPGNSAEVASAIRGI